jgi:triphosphoribosyl-dephospho-CoA synthase
MTYPKPGLVSHVDSGAHDDMDAMLMYRSSTSLTPYFTELACAGTNGEQMSG